MSKLEQLQQLNRILLEECSGFRSQADQFPQDETAQRKLLRSLMNTRHPAPLSPGFLALQDELLSAEREEKGVVETEALSAFAAYPQIALWQGDITRLRADAIVNAANSALLGCFCPCHGCIDNSISA